ncbi:hypothetical protein K3N28_05125 [Glycomyces sp. TRM65418]|uniref:hypothetical protein n=1 Tax=Glycomyces sp. TRM65418 TaxID=2867006 RepID=UPI001CE705C9|nr:hypothetical protein [Glycomyces sp. TRM65418]MCC3762450.1 hypothetical protein [Glycomyces sp. TRM65418]QZD56494.1 hypothetical protein K3N28_05085 [Glycomyces sp. TRM65418]
MSPLNPGQPREVVWLQPEYVDRPEELLTPAEIAQIAGVRLETAQRWCRLDLFPVPVKEEYFGPPSPRRYYVAVEVATWLLENPLQRREHVRSRERLQQALGVYDSQIAGFEQQLRHARSVRDQIAVALESVPSVPEPALPKPKRSGAKQPYRTLPEQTLGSSDSEPSLPMLREPRAKQLRRARREKAAEQSRGGAPKFQWSWERRDD